MNKLLLLASILTMTVSAQEVQTLLSEAQRDILRGDRAAAKEKFTFVQKLDPNNRIAMSYLRRMAVEDKQAGVDESAALRTKLEKMVIEKIEFRDATVSEALEFLAKKIAAPASGGAKVNIVQQLSDAEKSTKITLVLSNIAASEALRYVADLANLSVSYEKFAVVVKPKSAAQPAPAPKPAGGIKVDGL